MYHWTLKAFPDLCPLELYELMRLRSEVFVVEQNCVFLDADGKDLYCYHLLGRLDGPEAPLLAAYVRIVPPGVSYPEPSIGRVVTAPFVRGTGAGKALMEKALECLYTLYGNQPIKIGAQQHLSRFYGSLGFTPSSEMYMEDDIPHVEMTKNQD